MKKILLTFLITVGLLVSITAFSIASKTITFDENRFSFDLPIKLPSKALLETPQAGMIEFYNDRFYITNVGIQRPIDRTNDVATSTVTVTNTTGETIIYTGTIGANALKVGNLLKLHACGVVSNASAADDLVMKIYLGTDLVLTVDAQLDNADGDFWYIDGDMTVRTVGASGTMAYHLNAEIDGFTGTELGTGSVDTTTSEDFTVTVTWDNAKADNTISIYQGYTEWKN